VPFDGSSWTFEEPRDDLFRCLPLAVEAGRAGGAYHVVLNAANEVAVEAFLARRIGFLDIARNVADTLEAAQGRGLIAPASTLGDILAAVAEARRLAQSMLGRYV
jgi:1-deoxy-D-xylulose-5-phosphate reductoisomerase